MSASLSWDRAQRLYDKNLDLESKRRKSAQARVPSDPNAWQQIRENYEAIVLEDQTFSEKHNVESALWHLHYRRIEEFRAHLNAAQASSGSNASQGMRGPPRPDRVLKIRQQFRSFLSEATGFYHDLIMKIRAKYGLPLGHFSDDSESYNVNEKDGRKSSEMSKGLISCHRCLIYLGDLARYKGLYGEGQSRNCDHAAANSYYLQAASLCPSSGNPHHQLAILASYTGNELVAVYRYFRSLAVENPFSTARDNLTVAFEKNRLNYLKLLGEVKATAVQEAHDEGKGASASAYQDASLKPKLAKESMLDIHDTYKSFCTQFVRLNGILFTHTGLETFADVLSTVSSNFCELLSSGPEEKLIIGADPAENGLFIVRIVAILIYTVYNAKREAEGQSYTEIVQRDVVLQNSFTATFEIMGHISVRCTQLQDPSASYLLPGLTVFVEWLACFPDIVTWGEIDEKHATARSNFWKHCICLLNKLLSVVPLSVSDDVDKTFQDLARYEEGETENRLALHEDFELRGYLPLLPAQTILDFSRKHLFGGDGSKEKKARLKRILAAAKALAHFVRVDDKGIHYDLKLKKFVICYEPQKSDDLVSTQTVLPVENSMVLENQAQYAMISGFVQGKPQRSAEFEEEDEVIVFKPPVAEKHMGVTGSGSNGYKNVDQFSNGQNVLLTGVQTYNNTSCRIESSPQQTVLSVNAPHTSSANRVFNWNPQVSQSHTSAHLVGEDYSLLNGLCSFKLMDDGHVAEPIIQESMGVLQSAALSLPYQQSSSSDTRSLLYSQMKSSEALAPSNMNVIQSSSVSIESLSAKESTASQAGLKKNPISRPARHMGPPPGFSPFPSKQVNSPTVDINGEMPIIDDYSWLDRNQVPAPMKASGQHFPINHAFNLNHQNVNYSNGLTGTVSFPFPGRHVPVVLNGMENQEQLMQKPQHVMNERYQFSPLPEQYQGHNVSTSRPFV